MTKKKHDGKAFGNRTAEAKKSVGDKLKKEMFNRNWSNRLLTSLELLQVHEETRILSVYHTDVCVCVYFGRGDFVLYAVLFLNCLCAVVPCFRFFFYNNLQRLRTDDSFHRISVSYRSFGEEFLFLFLLEWRKNPDKSVVVEEMEKKVHKSQAICGFPWPF